MLLDKVRYFFWALLRSAQRDFSCPFCRTSQTHLIYRKALVTSLWECDTCGLRFRIPKGSEQTSYTYYQTAYKQEFTTDCPSELELKQFLNSGFRGSRDFGPYIEVLQAAGLTSGDALLDYGCSWGYGSWQMQQAGFRVYSYDVSRPRTTYAKNKLNCHVVEHLDDIPEKVKCLFSSHVLEHLDDPHIIWQAAVQVLLPEGMMVCFCPNGDPVQEQTYGIREYHKIWGKKHPLVLTRKSLVEMSKRYGFAPYVFSSPYSYGEIRSRRQPDHVSGSELLLLALRLP